MLFLLSVLIFLLPFFSLSPPYTFPTPFLFFLFPRFSLHQCLFLSFPLTINHFLFPFLRKSSSLLFYFFLDFFLITFSGFLFSSHSVSSFPFHHPSVGPYQNDCFISSFFLFLLSFLQPFLLSLLLNQRLFFPSSVLPFCFFFRFPSTPLIYFLSSFSLDFLFPSLRGNSVVPGARRGVLSVCIPQEALGRDN